MIISLGHKYIFVHALKTAGTSMALTLEARAMKDDIILGDTPKEVKRRKRLRDVKTAGRLWKHSILADVAARFMAKCTSQRSASKTAFLTPFLILSSMSSANQ